MVEEACCVRPIAGSCFEFLAQVIQVLLHSGVVEMVPDLPE